MKSQLYSGIVRHRRTSPKSYAFTYGVYYFGLDLDEIAETDRRIKLFSYNRPNVLSFLDRDHMGEPGRGVRVAMREHLAERGIDPERVDVTLVTNTRVLGYVFNPVSFYFVRGREDRAHA